MNTAKSVIESKKTQRSTSASGTHSKLNTDPVLISNNRLTGLRSIGPVTRSLAAAARSAFSSTKLQKSTSQPKIASQTSANRPILSTCLNVIPSINGTSQPRLPAEQANHKSQTLQTEKDKTKLLSKEIAVSKDSVFSDETDANINWIIGSQYEFNKDTSFLLKNGKFIEYDITFTAPKKFKLFYFFLNKTLNFEEMSTRIF